LKTNEKVIAIYDKEGLLVHIVDTLQQASVWIGCHVDTFYKSLHINNQMRAKGYTLEIITL